MKFSSTDKRSETVSLIRNKKNIFYRQKWMFNYKNRVLACFQTRPERRKKHARHEFMRRIKQAWNESIIKDITYPLRRVKGKWLLRNSCCEHVETSMLSCNRVEWKPFALYRAKSYITMGVQALEKAHKGFSRGIDVYHPPIGIPVQWIQFVVPCYTLRSYEYRKKSKKKNVIGSFIINKFQKEQCVWEYN